LRIASKLTRAEWALIALFLVTLPFVRAQIREDGISYYGVARSLVVDHNLQFKGDWIDEKYRPTIPSRDAYGRQIDVHVSPTGHVPVHSPIGTSLLWMPFLAVTHAAVLSLDYLGAHIPPNGFSEPYRLVMAGATCLYAFAGLWLSFSLARRYVDERWAFLATVAMWLASSLPAYIYVDPAWSHAHSVFAVALFLWYWDRTRGHRTSAEWFVLGLISGLMAEVYFPNAVIAVVIAVEQASVWLGKTREDRKRGATPGNYALYWLAVLIAFSPTFAIRTILLGGPLSTGAYGERAWHWTSPALLQTLLSPSQGVLTTTPIAIAAIVGMFLLLRRDTILARGLIAAFLAFWFLLSSYPLWNKGPAFGNRYFISLIPAFIVGLAFLLSECARLWGNADAFARRAWAATTLLVVWNLGLVFQWSIGLMPDVGRVYWDQVLYNQFRVVPGEALHALHSRFTFHPDQREDVRTAETPVN